MKRFGVLLLALTLVLLGPRYVMAQSSSYDEGYEAQQREDAEQQEQEQRHEAERQEQAEQAEQAEQREEAEQQRQAEQRENAGCPTCPTDNSGNIIPPP
ncbi:MAG TPA: hypothetical protein VJX68_09600 [Candidatus Binatus sp.]|uniref:hypothetical protein n=1 Tax=Candidatus Binatus sp. TaxID=2811406 RepID=UPI002B46A581|nr:hypothetical protein [Candidatus Binatus sp.]HKN13435.1 hypothetical protein [Candidatus Binatus sp.]